jgi:hypothetical protein
VGRHAALRMLASGRNDSALRPPEFPVTRPLDFEREES